MKFSDTTNKNGLVQAFEFWTRMPDGTVTGTLLYQVTARINAAYDHIMPLLLSFSDKVRFDDSINLTDKPVGTINLVSGQADYKITSDDNSLSILNITDVRILTSATETEYETIEKMTVDDENALEAMSPNPSNTGVPSYWLERGNVIYLYPEPDYSATNGIKLFFERDFDRFTSADTTQEPGIPKPFHELLVLYAALDWNMVNRSSDTSLLNLIRERIAKKEEGIRNMIATRYPTRTKISMKLEPYI